MNWFTWIAIAVAVGLLVWLTLSWLRPRHSSGWTTVKNPPPVDPEAQTGFQVSNSTRGRVL